MKLSLRKANTCYNTLPNRDNYRKQNGKLGIQTKHEISNRLKIWNINVTTTDSITLLC